MKTVDLIEALQSADKEFQKQFGKPMEIFDLVFNEDDYDGDLKISAVTEVRYEDDTFGWGSKRGMVPGCDVVIHFECCEGKIDDRAIRIEDIALPKKSGKASP